MKISDWILIVPSVHNGWTFAFAALLLAVWATTRSRR